MKKMKKTYTVYAATQKVWGGDFRFHYFETMKERNAFVRNTDYSDIAGTVKLNEAQYAQFKEFGHWDSDAE